MPHCKYSPSAAHRWLACPGSLTLPEPEGGSKSSVYADEGTAAHALLEKCWILGTDPSEYRGEEIEDFPITEEMIEAVQVCLDTVEAERALLQKRGAPSGVSVQAEQFITDPDNPDFGGTVDFSITSPDSLTIVDFKYGQGIPVEVKDNPQLLCYALLAEKDIYEGEGAFDSFRLVVVQPRCPHEEGPVRSWEPTVQEVSDFSMMLENFWEEKSSVFKAGDHCRFCPHKANCPELYQLTQATAAKEFEAESMTPEIAGELLERRGAIELYFKALEEWAHSRMESGEKIPGRKLVHRFGNRKYAVEDEEILKRCRSRKLGKRKVTETKILSPARLEKIAGKDFVNSLCSRPLLGTAVVPLSDRRKEVERDSAFEAFENLENSQ